MTSNQCTIKRIKKLRKNRQINKLFDFSGKGLTENIYPIHIQNKRAKDTGKKQFTFKRTNKENLYHQKRILRLT